MSQFNLPTKESLQTIAEETRLRREATTNFVIEQAINIVSKSMNSDSRAAEIVNGVPYHVFVRFGFAGENVVKDSDRIGVEVSIDIDSALKESCRRLNENKDFYFKVEESTPSKGYLPQFMFSVSLKPKPSLLARLFGFT